MADLQALYAEKERIFREKGDIRNAHKDGKITDEARAKISVMDKRWAELNEEIKQEEIWRDQEREAAESEYRAKQQKPNGGEQRESATLNYEGAFLRWMSRHPEGNALPGEVMRMLQTREVRGTDPQVSDVANKGGYLVPESFSNKLEDMMKWYGGMLDACAIELDPIGGTLRYPTGDDTAETGNIITPQGTASTVQDMTFGRVLFGDWTIDSGIIKASEEFMQDERVQFLSNFLQQRLAARCGRKVNSVLTNGTGTNAPYGLTVASTSTGITTASATAITKAELIKHIHTVDKAYRSGPSVGWMLHDETLGYLKTLDVGNTDTVQIFYPGLAVGQVDRLLGYKIFVNNDLTALTSSLPVAATKHIYFGDFSKYVIRKIRDISISRNDFLYWAEREVGFMGWLRLDGNLINQNAIKALKQHA